MTIRRLLLLSAALQVLGHWPSESNRLEFVHPFQGAFLPTPDSCTWAGRTVSREGEGAAHLTGCGPGGSHRVNVTISYPDLLPEHMGLLSMRLSVNGVEHSTWRDSDNVTEKTLTETIMQSGNYTASWFQDVELESGCHHMELEATVDSFVCGTTATSWFCLGGNAIYRYVDGFPVGLQCKDYFCHCEEVDSCFKPDADCQNWSQAHTNLSFPRSFAEFAIHTRRFLRGDFAAAPHDLKQDHMDMPIFVMSNPKRPDRARSTETLLRTVGFTDVRVPVVTAQAELDLDILMVQNWVQETGIQFIEGCPWIGNRSLKPYLSNAVDQLKTIETAALAGYPMFGIFEDDLMIGLDKKILQERLRSALLELPASADMLYLEYCYEQCDDICYKPEKFTYIARAYKPRCTAAILFTKKGARRIMTLCKPIFAGIDNMYPLLISRGFLEAYLMTPPAFQQDSYWGSDVLRKPESNLPHVRTAARHLPAGPICVEISNFHGGEFERDSLGWIIDTDDRDFEYLAALRGITAEQMQCLRQGGKAVVAFLSPEVQETNFNGAFKGFGYGSVENGTKDRSDFILTARTCEVHKTWPILTLRSFAIHNSSGCLNGSLCLLVKADIQGKAVPSERLILVRDFPRHRAKYCFLISASHEMEPYGHIPPHSGVVQLTFRKRSSNSHIIFLPNATRREQRLRLLHEMRRRFDFPTVRFEFLVFCEGETVLNGRCVKEAESFQQDQREVQLKTLLLDSTSMMRWTDIVRISVYEDVAEQDSDCELKILSPENGTFLPPGHFSLEANVSCGICVPEQSHVVIKIRNLLSGDEHQYVFAAVPFQKLLAYDVKFFGLGNQQVAVDLFVKGKVTSSSQVQIRVFSERSCPEACMLSSPGSGSHWLRFLIEYITGRATKGCHENPSSMPEEEKPYPGCNPIKLRDRQIKPIAKQFYSATASLCDHADNAKSPSAGCSFGANTSRIPFSCEIDTECCAKLIFVLRDFHESTLMSLKARRRQECESGQSKSCKAVLWNGQRELVRELTTYLDNILYFVHFTGQKILFRYEWMMSDITEPVLHLSSFFKTNDVSRVRDLHGFTHFIERQGLHSQIGPDFEEMAHNSVPTMSVEERCQLDQAFHHLLQFYPGSFGQLLRTYLDVPSSDCNVSDFQVMEESEEAEPEPLRRKDFDMVPTRHPEDLPVALRLDPVTCVKNSTIKSSIALLGCVQSAFYQLQVMLVDTIPDINGALLQFQHQCSQDHNVVQMVIPGQSSEAFRIRVFLNDPAVEEDKEDEEGTLAVVQRNVFCTEDAAPPERECAGDCSALAVQISHAREIGDTDCDLSNPS